jgi:hypothetical protein
MTRYKKESFEFYLSKPPDWLQCHYIFLMFTFNKYDTHMCVCACTCIHSDSFQNVYLCFPSGLHIKITSCYTSSLINRNVSKFSSLVREKCNFEVSQFHYYFMVSHIPVFFMRLGGAQDRDLS